MAHSNNAEAPRFRRPWYWLAVLCVGAALASVLVGLNARARVEQNERQFVGAVNLRLARMASGIDGLFDDSVNLVNLAAAVFANATGDRRLTEQLASELFAARPNPRIYGLGPFFTRGGFGVPGEYYSLYERRWDPRLGLGPLDRRLPDGTVEVENVSSASPLDFDYTRSRWFVMAMRAAGQRVIVGPYVEGGRNFISMLKAFKRDGRFVGVASVDILETDFKSILRSSLARGDVTWVNARSRKLPILSTGPIPPAGPHQIIRSTPLPYTHRATLSLRADSTAVDGANANIIVWSIGLILGIWLLAGVIAAGVIQRWRFQERAHLLELDQRRLEAEIALARTIEAELRKAAFTDSLTGLPNRAAFIERARAIVSGGDRDGHAVFFIDLDRFNIINETLGHLAGDDLLRAIGARLQALVEPTDLVARLGGDEFVVVANVESGAFDEAAALLLVHLGEPIVVAGRTIYPEASIGVVAVDESYTTPAELLRDADIAMYEAKHRGRAQFAIFDSEMRRRIADDSQLEDDLRRAIERGELVPYYQPIVSLSTRRIVSFEALARWNQHDGSVSTASEFMRFAEQHGFVEAIDAMMFRAVCSHSQAIFASFPSAQISVNISAAELATSGLPQTIETLIRQHEVSPSRLKFEITETAMMTSSEGAQRTLARLRDLGIEFVLDDFGTGYSSLAYLQTLPIAGIKIDRSFVEPLLRDPKAVEIVRSIVVLARSFGLTTIAEGVETFEHFQLLASLGVDHAQGFFFSPAVEISSLVHLVDSTISDSPHAAVE
jgi:diguanylate cyclase (GGDEF)-like protein